MSSCLPPTTILPSSNVANVWPSKSPKGNDQSAGQSMGTTGASPVEDELLVPVDPVLSPGGAEVSPHPAHPVDVLAVVVEVVSGSVPVPVPVLVLPGPPWDASPVELVVSAVVEDSLIVVTPDVDPKGSPVPVDPVDSPGTLATAGSHATSRIAEAMHNLVPMLVSPDGGGTP